MEKKGGFGVKLRKIFFAFSVVNLLLSFVVFSGRSSASENIEKFMCWCDYGCWGCNEYDCTFTCNKTEVSYLILVIKGQCKWDTSLGSKRPLCSCPNYWWGIPGYDASKPDTDADKVSDKDDNCPFISNDNQEDKDGDGVGDVCDNCPLISNSDQKDCDHDNVGNACDEDEDGDGLKWDDPNEQDDLNCDMEGSKDTDPPNNLPDGIDITFRDVSDALTKVMGAFGILMIAVQGVTFVTSQSPQERSSAKQGIVFVIIGLALLMVAGNFVGYMMTSGSEKIDCAPCP